MPKPSLSAANLVQGGSKFDIQRGKVEVMDARFKLVQYTKGDGGKITPMSVMQFDVVQLDDDWERDAESEESGGIQKDILICWANKQDGTFKFRPGLADSPQEVPSDAGQEIDTEGPTLFCDDWVGEDGEWGANPSLPFADSPFGLFLKSLEVKAWKPSVNAEAWAKNYVGLKMEIASVNPAELCKRYGIKHQAQQKEQPVWEVLDIHVKPYEKKGGGKAAGTTAATKPNGKVAPKSTAKPAEVEESAPEESEVEVNQTALEVIQAFGELNAGKQLTRKQVQTQLGPFMLTKYKDAEGKKIPMSAQKGVIGALLDEGQLVAIVGAIQGEMEGDKITFST